MPKKPTTKTVRAEAAAAERIALLILREIEARGSLPRLVALPEAERREVYRDMADFFAKRVAQLDAEEGA